jgi:hypothetical protein
MFDKKIFWLFLACAALVGIALTFGVLDASDLSRHDKSVMIPLGWFFEGIIFLTVGYSMLPEKKPKKI